MGKASSAKKVARLAERGKSKRVRFQGGTVFPAVVAAVLLLGVLLVAYSRGANRSDAVGPKIGTHWHLAYGIYICDEYLAPFTDDKETSPEYQELQIHSHGDGVMHWHPGNERAINRTTGSKAKFKVFLDLYGVDLSDSKLEIDGSELDPPETENRVYEEGKDSCTIDGKDEKASLRVVVWDRYDKPDARTVRTSQLGEERIKEDQQVFVVAWVPDSIDNSAIPLPPWAVELPELGAIDQAPATVTTVPTSATDAPASTAAPTTAAPPATSG